MGLVVQCHIHVMDPIRFTNVSNIPVQKDKTTPLKKKINYHPSQTTIVKSTAEKHNREYDRFISIHVKFDNRFVFF